MTDDGAARTNGINGVMRPNDVREANAAAILRLLLRGGPLPRAEISHMLGLTQGAVTRIVAELADQGLVQEGEPVNATTRGRPRVPVGIVPEARLSIGVHIGVRIVHASLMNLRGEEVLSRRTSHDGSVDGVVEDSARLIRELAAATDRALLGVGVIIGGWVEPATGTVRRHEILNWRDVDLAERLSTAAGMDILLEANSRAHALADVLYGEAQGHSSFAHIFVGHIVEASLVLDGRVHAGPDGLGGSLENWTMDDGHGRVARAWEVVGDGALTARARERGLIAPDATFEDLVDVARSEAAPQDPAATLLNDRAYRVGTLIAAIADLVGLDLVIVSSGVLAQEGAIDHVRRGLDDSRRGLPSPELRAEVNSSEILTRAASSVVLTATLLGGRDVL